VWWWGECRERGGARYFCVLWNGRGHAIVAGSFEAATAPYPGAYVRRRLRLPRPGESVEPGNYDEDSGLIGLGYPHGWLLPLGWVFNPSTKTKARVSGEPSSSFRLAEAIPMTADELKAFADRGEIP
jgi:hypothetical protein